MCSRGQPTPGNAAYGACKRGLVQLCASLAAEAREANKAASAGSGGGQVFVHIVSPGMVATDLLLRYATNPRSGECAAQGGCGVYGVYQCSMVHARIAEGALHACC